MERRDETTKDIVEKHLISIYNDGYNDAIEDVIDYLYSVKASKLDVYLQAELAASFRTFKKLNKHSSL